MTSNGFVTVVAHMTDAPDTKTRVATSRASIDAVVAVDGHDARARARRTVASSASKSIDP
jgi:hypothetical protein